MTVPVPARAAISAGWQVTRFRRGGDMKAAAMGMDVIVNGLNPPMYHDWARLIPAITEALGSRPPPADAI